MLANCGTAQSPQTWLKTRSRFRTPTKNWCMTIASAHGNPDVVLEKCSTSRARIKTQQWTVYGLDELRNNADGKCLTDPGASLTSGTPVNVTTCTNAKAQTWFVPESPASEVSCLAVVFASGGESSAPGRESSAPGRESSAPGGESSLT